MDFADLNVFKAVVEEGGITRAARKLNRVQSNVTTRIQQLEASLGTELFIRDRRRLFLSPAGKVFLDYVHRMLELSGEAREALHAGMPRGVLRIGTLESTAASRLPALLSQFHTRYPAVRIELRTDTTDALIEAVVGRAVDAAFAAECPEARRIEALPAFREELVIVAPLSHAPIRRAHDVRSDTVISFPAGCAYRRRLQAWLGSDGIVPDRVLEVASYHAILACVSSGTGIAIVPRSVIDTVKDSRSVAAYGLPAAVRWTTTALIWRKGESSAALDALRTEVRRLRNGGKKTSV